MNTISLRLCVMMFLQFFIWGSWFVTLGTFLGAELNAKGGQIALAFSTQSWGAIIAPFLIGLIADRYFNAERILGVLHLTGALLMYMMYSAESFTGFYPFVLAYMVLYMPTLALANSVAFRHLDDPAQQFSGIRVWGTMGWIIAGLAISYIFSWDSMAAIESGQLRNTFLLACTASALLGFFCFMLPGTPPLCKPGQKASLKELVGADALVLLKDRSFLVFFVCSILICIPLAFYYQNANPFLTDIGLENPTGKMTLGQISEALFILLLPVFIRRFGFKLTFLVGMLAWSIRYVLFAYGNAVEAVYMLLLGIALHGVCYDFFFVAGQIYTDSKASAQVRSAAQGLITLATYGIGMLIGFEVAGSITDHYQSADGVVWKNVWLAPAGIALLVSVLFAFFFREQKNSRQALGELADNKA